MIPKAESYLNRLAIVSLPKVRDLFSRFGRTTALGVHVEDGTPLLAQRKNDLCDEIERKASDQAIEPQSE